MTSRRRVLAVAAAGSLPVAGCLDRITPGTRDDASKRDTEQVDEHPAIPVMRDYLNAYYGSDMDAIRKHTHSSNPVRQMDGSSDETDFAERSPPISDVEHEIVTTDFGPDDIRDDTLVGKWFAEDEDRLEELFKGESAVLVESSYEESEELRTVERVERNIVLTEDGDWGVFFRAEKRVVPPAGDPVADDAYDIVTDVTFDVEAETATINLSGAGDVTATALCIYVSSSGNDGVYRSYGDETLPSSLTSLPLSFDAEGDEIVVTIVREGEEIVIHRESFEPPA